MELKELIEKIGKDSAFEFTFMHDNIATYESTLTYENDGNGFLQYVIEIIFEDGATLFAKEPLSELLKNHILQVDTMLCSTAIRNTQYFKTYNNNNK